MPDNMHNALRASIRALTEVVAPAVDPDNPLAGEQVGLVARMLDFVDQRLDLRHLRDRAELSSYISMALSMSESASVVDAQGAAALSALLPDAARLVADAEASNQVLQATTDRLTELISDIVQASGNADPGARQHIESVILSGSRPVLDLHRAWFLPTGFEADSSALPPLEELLSHKRSAVEVDASASVPPRVEGASPV